MIRRTIFISMVIFFSVIISSSGQVGIRKGFKIGYNISILTGDNLKNVNELKTLTGGVDLEFSLLGLLCIQGELLYSPKGAQSTIDGKEVETRLNYLTVPLFLKYKLFPVGFHPYLLGGIEFGSLLSAKQGGSDIKNNINSKEISVLLGAGIEFSLLGSSATIEGRYCQGIDNVYKNVPHVNIKNKVSQIFVGFLF